MESVRSRKQAVVRARGLLIALALVEFFAVTVARHQLITGDPATYIELAHNLVAGAGYTIEGAPHTFYPPGFPLGLTPVVALTGMNVTAAQVYVAVWAAIALLLAYAYYKRRGDVPAVAIALYLALNTGFYEVSTAMVRSEPLFVAASLALLLLLERRPPNGTLRSGIWLAGIALLGAAVPAIRTVGVAMVAALGASALQVAFRRWRGRERSYGAAVPLVAGMAGGVVFMMLWQLWIRHHGAGYAQLYTLKNPLVPDQGLATPRDLASRVVAVAAMQTARAAQLTSNVLWRNALWISPAVLLVAPIIVIGWVQEFRRAVPVAAWYLLCYAGVILVWPFDEGTRYLLPLLPFFALFAVRGATQSWPLIYRALPWMSAAGIIGTAAEIRATGDASIVVLAVLAFWIAMTIACITVALRDTASRTPLIRAWRAGILPAAGIVYAALGTYDIGRLVQADITGTRRNWSEYIRDALPWIRSHTRPDDRIMTFNVAAVHFYTQRHAMDFPITADPYRMCRALSASRPSYLIATTAPLPYRPTQMDRVALLNRMYPDGLQLVFSYRAGRIYRVSPEAEGPCGQFRHAGAVSPDDSMPHHRDAGAM